VARNRAETRFTVQKILNMVLDDKVSGAIVPMITNLEWVDANDAFVKRPAMGYPPRTRTEYDANNDMEYQAFNLRHDAADADTDWIIIRRQFTSHREVQSQTLVRSWDGRAAAGWAW
jgi:hypothetical protein